MLGWIPVSKTLLREYNDLFRGLRTGLQSTIVRNAASLYAIRFADYIIPLIMVPYLVRVLGPAGYGAVGFGQGLVNYITLSVDYGFDWSATRRISVERANPSMVNWIALPQRLAWSVKILSAFFKTGIGSRK